MGRLAQRKRFAELLDKRRNISEVRRWERCARQFDIPGTKRPGLGSDTIENQLVYFSNKPFVKCNSSFNGVEHEFIGSKGVVNLLLPAADGLLNPHRVHHVERLP